MRYISFKSVLVLPLMSVFMQASANCGAVDDYKANCGAVDYSKGADALKSAAEWVGSMTIYTMDLLFAIAAIVVVISALQIYIKINNHEGDITKSILFLFGGILFMIAIMFIAPAFFGYQNLIITF